MPKQSFAQRYINAWNQHHTDRIASFFDSRASYIDSALNVHAQGHSVAHHIDRVLSLCPDASFELIDTPIIGNGRMAIPWLLRSDYAHRLSAQPVETEIASAGISGIDYITYNRDKILSTRVYLDLSPYIPLDCPPVVEEQGSNRQGRYKKSGLSDEGLKQFQAQLQSLMEQELLYLEEKLTLAGLAQRLELSTNHLSQVINSQFKMSFNDYINSYRVAYAKSLIEQQCHHKNLSILDIAFESGFGSSSTFYLAFQKSNQTSPLQYLKYCRAKQ